MSFDDMAKAAENTTNLPVEFTFDTSLVRTVIKDGEAWFVAKDMCEILDIANPRDAIAEFDEDEKGVVTTDTVKGLSPLMPSTSRASIASSSRAGSPRPNASGSG